MSGLSLPRLSRHHVDIHVAIPTHVANKFTAEIRDNPRVEVGGKYVGFIRGGRRFGTLEERRKATGGLVLELLDFIDDGPRAERNPGFHRGDPAYQTQAFRSLEARWPDIEHLGSWHSHHPNGLRRLSDGDISGYQETVDAADHNHDFFVVSLGIDLGGFRTARHFLFIRGDHNYYELTHKNIFPVSDEVSPGADTVGVCAASDAPSVGGPGNNADAAEPKQAQDASAHAKPPPVSGTSGTSEGATPDKTPRRIHVPGWSDSPNGQEILLREQELRRTSRPELRHVVKSNRLLAVGQVEVQRDLRIDVQLLYPSTPGATDGLLKLSADNRSLVEASLGGAHAMDLIHALAALDAFARFAVKASELAGEPSRGWLGRIFG